MYPILFAYFYHYKKEVVRLLTQVLTQEIKLLADEDISTQRANIFLHSSDDTKETMQEFIIYREPLKNPSQIL